MVYRLLKIVCGLPIIMANEPLECQRCGDCCQEVHIPIKRNAPIDKYTIEWYRARGIKVKGNTLIIPSMCPQLTYVEYQGQLIACCTIQTHKPLICKNGKCMYL